MKRTALLLSLTVVIGIAIGIIATQVLNAQQEPIRRTVLLQTDLPGIEGKEARVILSEFAPGASVGKHYHPGHEIGYLIEGTGVLEVEGKPPVPVNSGEAFYQPPKQVHNFRNPSTTNPNKLLLFFIPEKGQPFVVPVQ